jgi:hypothetical protein
VPTGHVFRLETGARFTAIECSDFNLFTTYLMNGDAATRAILADRKDVGFNLLRVWLAYWDTNTGGNIPGIGRLIPSDFPGMYDRLASFCALAASYGLYVEFTAFTGGHIDGHWDGIGHGLEGVTNAIVELCNENDAHPVRIDPRAYAPLPGVVCSHGSNASQALPVRPWWQYETMHFNDAPEWQRKVGHNSMEISDGDPEGHITPSHVPVLANENTRPDRDGTIHHFHDAAAGAALLCAGSCFHSQSGKASVPFDSRDRSFAEAWVAGARSVNLDYQDGRYVREAPGPYLRVYSRVNPGGSRETVQIRK